MKVAVIIPAAGSGQRFGFKKQFFKLADRYLVEYSLETMSSIEEIKQIILAVPPEDLNWVKEAGFINSYGPKIEVLAGGASRQETVSLSLKKVKADMEVLIVHDGARPFASKTLVSFIIANAYHLGAVVPGIPIVDTIKTVKSSGQIKNTLARGELRAIQTPQAFKKDILLAAYRQAEIEGLEGTDDAGLVEALGQQVYVFPGERNNIKITSREDIDYANYLLGSRKQSLGFGTDIHPLVPARDFYLGGVKIPFDKGCEAHSDGDVLIHALIDALLGAACLKDIGSHFPDSQDKYKNISSLILLEESFALIKAEGWQVGNIDCTISLEKPKLAPYLGEMKRNISQILDIKERCLNIKATTAEGLGAIGRGEGVLAQVIALLYKGS